MMIRMKDLPNLPDSPRIPIQQWLSESPDHLEDQSKDTNPSYSSSSEISGVGEYDSDYVSSTAITEESSATIFYASEIFMADRQAPFVREPEDETPLKEKHRRNKSDDILYSKWSQRLQDFHAWCLHKKLTTTYSSDILVRIGFSVYRIFIYPVEFNPISYSSSTSVSSIHIHILLQTRPIF